MGTWSQARLHVERAIKEKKIFTVQGPYPVIRRLLWARGWVERKLPGLKGPGLSSATAPSTLPPGPPGGRASLGQGVRVGWGVPCLTPAPSLPQSRLVRDQVPYFIWTNRCDAVDRRLLRQDQLVNHYARVGAFTTKDGLCLNLRNLPWFDQADPDTFFPRCYRLGAVDDRQAFIGEFRAGVNPPRLSPSCCPHPLCSWFPRVPCRTGWGQCPPPCRGFLPDGSSQLAQSGPGEGWGHASGDGAAPGIQQGAR
uniref:Uncharacterized protein n=1 Tax=Otus sunia TaxID=257818 RepID=A0A8C8E7U7_9STRI